jgi:hypothetical protein
MIFYVVGLCLFSIFDLIELVNNSKPHEKILFTLLFFAALIFGVWYFSEYIKPSYTRGLIDYFNMKNINY